MPRGQRTTGQPAAEPKASRTPKPKLSDAEKAVATLETETTKLLALEEQLRTVRARAAELDEQAKHQRKVVAWAAANPFIPEDYSMPKDQAIQDGLPDVDAAKDEPVQPTLPSDVTAPPLTDDGGDAELPGLESTTEAAEERVTPGVDSTPPADDDDPFAGLPD